MALNPKLKDFLEENPNKTLVGFMWSLWWRFVICVYGAIAVGALLILGIASLSGNSNNQSGYSQTSGSGNTTDTQYQYQPTQ